MIGKIIGMVILGALAAICFYSAGISRSSHDIQGYWLFLAFGMFFFVPMVIVAINLISRRSKAFKKVYDKLAGTDKPQTARFAPHWFMIAAMAILLACLLSFIVTFIASLIK